MTIMKEIGEAVDRLDLAGANEEFREDVQEIAEAHHLGRRALAQWLTESANETQWLADYALREFQGIGPGDDQPPGACLTAYPVYVQTERRGSTILVALMAGAVGHSLEGTLAEYLYDRETDELTRVYELTSADA